MKISLSRYAVEGEQAPWGYGLAYWDYSSYRAVLYPIPLNWIVWVSREIYFRLFVTPVGIERTIGTQQYSDGWIHGYYAGIKEGHREAEQTLIDDYNRMVVNDRRNKGLERNG